MEEAEQYFEQALRVSPTNGKPYYYLGVIASQKKEYDRALGFLAQALIGLEQSRRKADPWRDGAAYYGWLVGIPVLAGGFFFNVPVALAAGAALLLAATLVRPLDGGTSLANRS